MEHSPSGNEFSIRRHNPIIRFFNNFYYKGDEPGEIMLDLMTAFETVCGERPTDDALVKVVPGLDHYDTRDPASLRTELLLKVAIDLAQCYEFQIKPDEITLMYQESFRWLKNLMDGHDMKCINDEIDCEDCPLKQFTFHLRHLVEDPDFAAIEYQVDAKQTHDIAKARYAAWRKIFPEDKTAAKQLLSYRSQYLRAFVDPSTTEPMAEDGTTNE